MFVSFFFATTQSMVLTWFHQPGEEDALSVKIGGLLAMGGVFFCWVISVFSIVYGLIKLCRPNISQKIRMQVMLRHVAAMTFFTVCELYLEIGTFIIFQPKYWGKTKPSLDDKEWVYVLKIFFAMQGVYLPISRLAEPFFYQILISKTKAFARDIGRFCESSESRRKRLAKEERNNDLTFLKRDLPLLSSTQIDESTGFAVLEERDTTKSRGEEPVPVTTTELN